MHRGGAACCCSWLHSRKREPNALSSPELRGKQSHPVPLS